MRRNDGSESNVTKCKDEKHRLRFECSNTCKVCVLGPGIEFVFYRIKWQEAHLKHFRCKCRFQGGYFSVQITFLFMLYRAENFPTGAQEFLHQFIKPGKQQEPQSIAQRTSLLPFLIESILGPRTPGVRGAAHWCHSFETKKTARTQGGALRQARTFARGQKCSQTTSCQNPWLNARLGGLKHARGNHHSRYVHANRTLRNQQYGCGCNRCYVKSTRGNQEQYDMFTKKASAFDSDIPGKDYNLKCFIIQLVAYRISCNVYCNCAHSLLVRCAKIY